MSVVPAQELQHLAEKYELIKPFSKKTKLNGLTYGLSECGYDVRIDQTVTLYPVTLWNLILKLLGFKRPSFLLASTVEKFNVPKDMMFLILDKSTWARLGLATQNTIAEPGWGNSFLTLELTNHGDKVIHIERGTAIAQAVFFRLSAETHFPYNGKYQNQKAGPQEAVHSV